MLVTDIVVCALEILLVHTGAATTRQLWLYQGTCGYITCCELPCSISNHDSTGIVDKLLT